MKILDILIVVALFATSSAAESVHLSLALDSSGHVRVSYEFPNHKRMKKVGLFRTFLDMDRLNGFDIYAFPITKVILPNDVNKATRVDSILAEGVTYSYYIIAVPEEGEAYSCNVAKITMASDPLPPQVEKDCFLLVDKTNYVLEVHSGTQIVRAYPICLGENPVDRKLFQDNLTTPEGLYKITCFYPKSQFYKAIGIDYPNAVDRERYLLAKKNNKLPRTEEVVPGIGGSILIHGGSVGNNWTWGCVAMQNPDIDELLCIPAMKVGTRIVIVGSEFKREDVGKKAH
jgi:hypothetical protein